jgi:hypothetical protein
VKVETRIWVARIVALPDSYPRHPNPRLYFPINTKIADLLINKKEWIRHRCHCAVGATQFNGAPAWPIRWQSPPGFAAIANS